MKTSETVNELFAALSKAQGAFSVAIKDSSNSFLNKNYADFQSIVEAARPALAANGLGFTQMPTMIEDKFLLVTRIFHSSGQWMESHTPIKPTKDDAQGIGAAITYSKRQALQSGLGVIASDEDSGADKEMDNDKPDRTASKADVVTLMKAFQGVAVSEKQVLARLGISDVYKMTEANLASLRDIGWEIKQNKSKVTDHFKPMPA